ncbi:MAG: class I SAM-dependent DNA methyltransferase [Acidobacteriota bacterium]
MKRSVSWKVCIGKNMDSWSEDESFWKAMEPALCAPARIALAEADVAKILSIAPVREGSTILDLACGPGSHAVEFARRGHFVTGLDQSASLLGRARAAAEARNLRIEWIRDDMRTFRRPSAFDLVCSLYASLAYFDDVTNRLVLENVHASIKADGVFVLDVLGRESLARNWQERAWTEVDGTLYFQRRRVADSWSTLVEEWSVVTNGKRNTYQTRQRLYAGTELRDLLLSVGFSRADLFGSLDGNAYDESARRLIAVARV